MKVHHVGYLVGDLNEALKKFLSLGFAEEKSAIFDPDRNIDFCFIISTGGGISD